jgi:hypothetical protein
MLPCVASEELFLSDSSQQAVPHISHKDRKRSNTANNAYLSMKKTCKESKYIPI